jgi:hypothetical protein
MNVSPNGRAPPPTERYVTDSWTNAQDSHFRPNPPKELHSILLADSWVLMQRCNGFAEPADLVDLTSSLDAISLRLNNAWTGRSVTIC